MIERITEDKLLTYAYDNALTPEERAEIIPLKLARGEELTESQAWFVKLFQKRLEALEASTEE